MASMAMRPRPRRAGRRGWENKTCAWGKVGLGWPLLSIKGNRQTKIRLTEENRSWLERLSKATFPTCSINRMANAVLDLCRKGKPINIKP